MHVSGARLLRAMGLPRRSCFREISLRSSHEIPKIPLYLHGSRILLAQLYQEHPLKKSMAPRMILGSSGATLARARESSGTGLEAVCLRINAGDSVQAMPASSVPQLCSTVTTQVSFLQLRILPATGHLKVDDWVPSAPFLQHFCSPTHLLHYAPHACLALCREYWGEQGR